jgi:hypothetical protein
MRLRIRRRGGIAGVTLKADVDTAELPADSATRLDAAVRGLAGGGSSGPPHPDGFRYEITQLDDPRQASVVLGEHEVPPELNGLIEAVNESGEIEHPGSSGAK